MIKPFIANWASRQCPEGEEDLRIMIILRALYEADDRGILPKLTPYRVRQWVDAGKVVSTRVLAELHEIGFFRTSGRLTEIVPYKECLQPTSIRQRLEERESDGGGYFDGERQPLWGRPRSARS